MRNMGARMRAKRKKAPASVFFTTKGSDMKKAQPCVFVACLQSGMQAGPVWGHGKRSVDRALLSLTKKCECPAKFHQAMEFAGFRIGQHAD